MERLRQRDFDAILDAVRALQGARSSADFATTAARALRRLVPAEIVSYNEIGQARPSLEWVSDPGDFAFPGGSQAFAAHMHTHPFIEHRGAMRPGEPMLISDFLSSRQFRQRAIHAEFYRPIGVDHVMGCNLAAPDGLIVAVAALRRGRNFSERDRQVVRRLGPHLMLAYENAATGERLAADLPRLAAGVETLGHALVQADAEGRILVSSEMARRRLVSFFGRRAATLLPEEMLDWVRRQGLPRHLDAVVPEVPRPFVARRPGARLMIRAIDPDRMILLLEQQLDPAPPSTLGLTPRERQVLREVARGGTNRQVAEILGLSPRTVQHTLERIYRKLGVNSRAAAVARLP